MRGSDLDLLVLLKSISYYFQVMKVEAKLNDIFTFLREYNSVSLFGYVMIKRHLFVHPVLYFHDITIEF